MSSTKRKARRALEQAAIEALYWLCERKEWTPDASVDAFAVLDDAITDYGRFFRCPRCLGHGDDPEQPSQDYPPTDPPDPCGLCNGYGTYGPRGHFPPWEKKSELFGVEALGQDGQDGQPGKVMITWEEL